ncbi:MAG: glycoside hydrolase family 2 TIM barrel-domain containing protein, partial [Clostridia bacterium]|nr:glycoside hydrolase family 2 TIM barrel-domain containing protein [Clostridia bacterium]
IERLVITPRYFESAVELCVVSDAQRPCEVRYAGRTQTVETNRPALLPMPDFRPWTPEDPHLYELTVTMDEDRVESYFAMRAFGTGPDERGLMRLLLNGKPYFHTGVLDQGYWPDGLYTAPSDEAMVADIRLMKDMGFNMLRKHIKIEPLRWYYHCDRLGMLVWQDMVNGGGVYKKPHISLPLVFGNSHRDSDYAYFAREDLRGREEYMRELEETVRLLCNCPCVAVWVPFNEGWGQFDAARAAERLRALDPSRTIDH